jgi:hypothetical protein
MEKNRKILPSPIGRDLRAALSVRETIARSLPILRRLDLQLAWVNYFQQHGT